MIIKKIKQDGKVTIEIHISFNIFHRLAKAIKKFGYVSFLRDNYNIK